MTNAAKSTKQELLDQIETYEEMIVRNWTPADPCIELRNYWTNLKAQLSDL